MPIKLINVNIMSQLTSRGLDNTSSAFVSDTYIHTYRYIYIYIDNFHPFCKPYIEISIKGGAFWDYRFFRSQSKLCIRLG